MPRKPTDDGPRRPSRSPRAGSPARSGAKSEHRFGGKPGVRKGPAGPRQERPKRDQPRAKTGQSRARRAELPAPTVKERERVAKVIARAGLASRREIEEWIEAGRVAVTGEVLDSPAFTVTGSDRIEVDGAPLPQKERTRLFLFHKPRGLVTTTDDPEGRPTVFDMLPAGLPRLVSVGRLDFNTEGLLLLTNDGGLARVLELPETGWLRRYRVRAFGEVTQDQLDKLREGVEVEGMHYGPIEATLDREQGSNVWITVALREGKKREIRTVLGALGVHVNRLIRLSFGPFQLGELAEGAVEEVKTRVLRDQLGEQLAALAGADFDAPLRDYSEAETARQEPARKEPRQESRPERPARRERPEREERPARGRFEDREERGERRGRPERSDRPLREPSNRRKPSIWRAAPEGEATLTRKMMPRRERAAIPPASEDPRPKRRSKTEDRKGRSIQVERIASPQPEAASETASAPAERARPFIRHGERPEGDRPFKPRGDRPFRERGEGGERSFRARGERPEGDRPFKPRGDRPGGKFGDNKFGGKPGGSRAGRPGGKPGFSKPRFDKPGFDKPRGPRRPGPRSE